MLILSRATFASAQMALVQRMDLGLGSDRKFFAEWLLKQGFTFDTEAQPTTRTMASGIGLVTGLTVYGETYLNNAGNIRIRLFTDTLFSVYQIQTILSHPVTEEAGNFMAALKTIGYQLNNTYDNKVDRTRNRLLQKDGKSFRVIEAMDGTYLLVKAQRKDAYPVNH